MLSGGKLNEFTFQYSYFHNHIGEVSTLPTETYPNGVVVGTSVNVPQTTEQHKYQFRDDFTWTKGKHELRVGASFIYEPTLDITFSTGQQPLYSHLADSRTSRDLRASATTARSAARAASAGRRSRTTSTPSTSRTAGGSPTS